MPGRANLKNLLVSGKGEGTFLRLWSPKTKKLHRKDAACLIEN